MHMYQGNNMENPLDLSQRINTYNNPGQMQPGGFEQSQNQMVDFNQS